jgi:actin-like ATPase involved in cell morphogenesis
MISYIHAYSTQSFVGESTAEKIKIQIGAAIEDLETPPEDMSSR